MRLIGHFWIFYRGHSFLYRPTGIALSTLGLILTAGISAGGYLPHALSFGLFFHTLTLVLVCSEIGVATHLWHLFTYQRDGVRAQGIVMQKVRRTRELWPFSGPDILYHFADESGAMITAREERIRAMYTAPLNAADTVEVVYNARNPRQCCLLLKAAPPFRT